MFLQINGINFNIPYHLRITYTRKTFKTYTLQVYSALLSVRIRLLFIVHLDSLRLTKKELIILNQ